MISLKEASAYLETALFGVFYYQLITIFRIFGFLQHQMVSHLSQKDQLQDLGKKKFLDFLDRCQPEISSFSCSKSRSASR
ncbi:MAG: hypothetical protein SD837_15630 [Candidatus Electrothrix scaldis]|nr:MAG: hypothetical protein SD837_15630 [Candidatus Electrothrix sp. GW3-3]